MRALRPCTTNHLYVVADRHLLHVFLPQTWRGRKPDLSTNQKIDHSSYLDLFSLQLMQLRSPQDLDKSLFRAKELMT